MRYIWNVLSKILILSLIDMRILTYQWMWTFSIKCSYKLMISRYFFIQSPYYRMFWLFKIMLIRHNPIISFKSDIQFRYVTKFISLPVKGINFCYQILRSQNRCILCFLSDADDNIVKVQFPFTNNIVKTNPFIIIFNMVF